MGGRRARVAALLLVAAAGLAGACTGTPEEPPDGPILVAAGTDLSASRIYQQLVDVWNARHPDDEDARLVELSPVADRARSQLVATAGGGRNSYDVYLLDVIWTAEFAEAGYVEALPELSVDDRQDFLDMALESATYGGDLYGLPFATDAGLLYYRSDVLDDHGQPPPRRWNDLWDAAARIVPADDRVSVGFAGQFAEYEGLVVNALEHIYAQCGENVPVDGELEVRVNDCTVRTLRGLAAEIREFGSTGESVIPGGALGYTETESLELFASKKALFMRNWPYAYGVLDADPTAPPFKVAPLPGSSVLGGHNLALAAGAPHHDAALELIRFLTSEDCQRRLMREGNLAPTRNSAFNDPWGDDSQCRPPGADPKPPRKPDDRAALPVPQRCFENDPQAAECGRWLDYLATLRTAVANADERPRTPYYPRFSEVFQRMVHRGLENGSTPSRTEFTAALTRALEGR